MYLVATLSPFMLLLSHFLGLRAPFLSKIRYTLGQKLLLFLYLIFSAHQLFIIPGVQYMCKNLKLYCATYVGLINILECRKWHPTRCVEIQRYLEVSSVACFLVFCELLFKVAEVLTWKQVWILFSHLKLSLRHARQACPQPWYSETLQERREALGPNTILHKYWRVRDNKYQFCYSSQWR